ncbi:MAG: hypothetical protein U5K69_26440 [Balneolaceae bacterium]|nr:hypothetical protein [Balneolaceae bacterium]
MAGFKPNYQYLEAKASISDSHLLKEAVLDKVPTVGYGRDGKRCGALSL